MSGQQKLTFYSSLIYTAEIYVVFRTNQALIGLFVTGCTPMQNDLYVVTLLGYVNLLIVYEDEYLDYGGNYPT